jgi:hypothetical protein
MYSCIPGPPLGWERGVEFTGFTELSHFKIDDHNDGEPQSFLSFPGDALATNGGNGAEPV